MKRLTGAEICGLILHIDRIARLFSLSDGYLTEVRASILLSR